MSLKCVIVYTFVGKELDLEIPDHISADTLIKALYAALDPQRPCPDYIRSENPVALLHGSSPVEQYGLRDGSKIFMT